MSLSAELRAARESIQEFYFHLSLESSNGKTGDIPVSTTSFNSCSIECPFMDSGCFGQNFPLALHWLKVSAGQRGMSLERFCHAIGMLPDGQLWRHNQAGDMPGNRLTGILFHRPIRKIVNANRGRRGFTYCHYDPTKPQNAKIIKWANQNGFTINLSANNIAQADRFVSLGIASVTVVLPAKQKTNFKTPAGNQVTICPKETRGIQCKDCELCHKVNRKCIVGFPAIGTRKKQAELVTIQ